MTYNTEHKGQLLRQRVDSFLSETGRSKTQFAREIGTSRSTMYYQFELEQPSTDFVLKIARKIGQEVLKDFPDITGKEGRNQESKNGEISHEAKTYKEMLIECQQEKVELYQKIIDLHKQIADLLKK